MRRSTTSTSPTTGSSRRRSKDRGRTSARPSSELEQAKSAVQGLIEGGEVDLLASAVERLGGEPESVREHHTGGADPDARAAAGGAHPRNESLVRDQHAERCLSAGLHEGIFRGAVGALVPGAVARWSVAIRSGRAAARRLSSEFRRTVRRPTCSRRFLAPPRPRRRSSPTRFRKRPSVPRRDGPTLDVDYDGPPRFSTIEETPLQYATNTATPVIEVSPTSYYAVRDGVWFTAATPTGPWVVADSVPPSIYSIPTSSPMHQVTYVYVDGSSPGYVYDAYAPGYLGTVVAPSGVVVYGTGYDYSPWIGNYWYGGPWTYGYGAGLAVGVGSGSALRSTRRSSRLCAARTCTSRRPMRVIRACTLRTSTCTTAGAERAWSLADRTTVGLERSFRAASAEVLPRTARCLRALAHTQGAESTGPRLRTVGRLSIVEGRRLRRRPSTIDRSATCRRFRRRPVAPRRTRVSQRAGRARVSQRASRACAGLPQRARRACAGLSQRARRASARLPRRGGRSDASARRIRRADAPLARTPTISVWSNVGRST